MIDLGGILRPRPRAAELRRAAGPDRSQHHSRNRRSRHRQDAGDHRARAAGAACGGADPGRRSQGADGAADAALAASQANMPARSPFPAARSTRPTRRRSMPRCARREEEVGLDRSFIDPIGYLDVYGTGFGFRILPTVARVKPGFKLTINHSEVDRRLRGAAVLPDESGEPPAAQQGISRHGALLLRHAVCRTLYLGRDRGHPAGPV